MNNGFFNKNVIVIGWAVIFRRRIGWL